MQYTIQPMTRSQMDVAIEWAAREGWNPGQFDAGAFYAADPGGFLVGLLDEEPVATISAVAYGESFGFIGMYIVRPDCRGQGYGWKIWQAAMARLQGRNIGLDGVVAQQANYARSGFRLAHRNIRFQLDGLERESVPASARGRLVGLASISFDRIAGYDRGFFPAPREALLQAWLHQPRATAVGLEREGRLIGYGAMRACRSGHKIGPLFADTPDAAESLFSALSAHAEAGAPVFLDVPETNPAALALAERHGLRKVFETARMYTGQVPDIALERTYGITSFELG